MAYAFKFDCYDEIDNPDLDKWDRKTKDVRVVVVADTEEEAMDKAKALFNRQKYDLSSVVELNELSPVD